MGFLDFLGRIGDTVGNWGSSLGGFVQNTAPLLGLGAGLYGMNQQESAQNKQREAMKELQQMEYDQAMAMLQAQGGAGGGGGGGGGGMNRAAAMANEQARLAANKKAMKVEKRYGKKARKALKPWADTGERLLPEVEKTYRSSLEGMNALKGYLFQPENMQKLDSRPVYHNAELPVYMRGGKKNG